MDPQLDASSLAPRSTARCYISRWRSFSGYCAGLGLDATRGLDALSRPEREALFTSFALHHLSGAANGRRLAPTTVAAYLATIRRLVLADHPQILPEEFAPALRAARIHSIARNVNNSSMLLRPDQIAAAHMALLVATLNRETMRGCLDAAVLTVHHALGTTGRQTANLQIGDLHLHYGVGLDVRLGHPPTTREIIMPYHDDATICPVRAVHAWQRILAERGITEGPLFRPVDQYDNIGVRASGRRTASGAISASYAGKVLRRTAAAAGLLDTLGASHPSKTGRYSSPWHPGLNA